MTITEQIVALQRVHAEALRILALGYQAARVAEEQRYQTELAGLLTLQEAHRSTHGATEGEGS